MKKSLTELAKKLAALALLSSFPALAFGHGGGLDAHGGHHDRKSGGYHCHQGPLAGKSFASKNDMLNALDALKKKGEGNAPVHRPSQPEKGKTTE